MGFCPQNCGTIRKLAAKFSDWRDCLADGAVRCEPVSASYSLIYREKTGKFRILGPDLTSNPSETPVVINAFI
jgi:hypothetical protein